MSTPADQHEELSWLKSQLAKMLSLADDASFLRLVWALNALQTGRPNEASRFLNGFPSSAAAEGILQPNAIRPWELETLANELLCTPKNPYYRSVDCAAWNTAILFTKQLRSLEELEYAVRRYQGGVLVEMGRLGARQFPWQRGYLGIPQLYRNTFIYGQGESAAYLKETLGVTAVDMTFVGFSMLSLFYAEPTIRPSLDFRSIDQHSLKSQGVSLVLDRISCPLAKIRDMTALARGVDAPTAYKPSILRRYPCLRVGPRNRQMIAPLPDLIMDRVTNGLFYDVIGGGGLVREEIGGRFEEYCFGLLREMLPETSFTRETNYHSRLGPIATPDIIMFNDADQVQLVFECKASRMSVKARFGDTPQEDRGYEEIAKGVMQLWRFFAHCRTQVTSHRMATDAYAVILTMDEWFAGRTIVIPQIMLRANELANESAHLIPNECRVPVAFCTVSELEDVLQTATTQSLLETVRVASGDKVGWIFSILHQDTHAEKTHPKPYPFEKALGGLLPWWEELDDILARDL